MNTQSVIQLCGMLDKARRELASEINQLEKLRMQAGQVFGNFTAFGKSYSLVEMDSRSYGPRATKSMEEVRQILIRIQGDTVSYLKGQVEGLEFMIKEAARSRP